MAHNHSNIQLSGQSRVHLGDNISPFVFREMTQSYGNTEVSGQATAIVGNNYGKIENVYHNTTVVNGPGAPCWLVTHPKWVIRQNRVLGQYTLETVRTYQSGGPIVGRGQWSQVEYRWYRQEDLGGGLYAEVYKEEQFEDPSVATTRAVKVLSRRLLRKLNIDYKRELNALIQLSQPQYQHMYIHFFGWYEHHDNIYIAMEYAPYGDLSTHINQGLSEGDVKDIGCQILEGIRVMHNLDFVHRDIEPANILVFEPGPSWHVKIGDFSITKTTLTQHTTLHTNIGTAGYKAPEIMGFVPVDDKDSRYDAKCDLWSLGCLLLECITGSAPFLSPHILYSYCRSVSSPLRELFSATAHEISEAGLQFLEALLTPDPSQRPDAETATDQILDWLTLATDALRHEDRVGAFEVASVKTTLARGIPKIVTHRDALEALEYFRRRDNAPLVPIIGISSAETSAPSPLNNTVGAEPETT